LHKISVFMFSGGVGYNRW